MVNNFIQSVAVIVDAYLVCGKQCGRIPKFNMADSAKKRPSPGCFRQLDCVFQYSCTSFSILQFHSPILLLCSQPTAGCSLWSWLLVMSHCHDFNLSSNTWIFFFLTFVSNCSFVLPVVFLNAAAAVAAILPKRLFISYLLALSSRWSSVP